MNRTRVCIVDECPDPGEYLDFMACFVKPCKCECPPTSGTRRIWNEYEIASWSVLGAALFHQRTMWLLRLLSYYRKKITNGSWKEGLIGWRWTDGRTLNNCWMVRSADGLILKSNCPTIRASDCRTSEYQIIGLSDFPTVGLSDCRTDWLTDWLNDTLLAHWPTQLVTDKLTDWLTDWLTGSLAIHYYNGWFAKMA